MTSTRGCKHGPGFTRCYMRKRYGASAFNADGTLNLKALRREKSLLMNEPHSRYVIAAITEAINFKHRRI